MRLDRRCCRIRRTGSAKLLVIGALLCLFTAGGGAWVFFGQGDSGAGEVPILKSVVRGPYEAVVLDQGEVESSRNVEIRCEVRSRNNSGTAILDVVAEGEHVRGAFLEWEKDPLGMRFIAPVQWCIAMQTWPDEWPLKGQVLVQLASTDLEQELNQQQVIVNTSEARVITAESNLEAARITKEEYEEGTFKQDEQTILNEEFDAEENLKKAEQHLKFSERLAANSYITALELRSDQVAVVKAQNSLDLAKRKLRVLRDQTKRKNLIEFEALIRAAQVTYNNEVKSHEVELGKLDEIHDQIRKCTMRVPPGVSGQVVYANKFSSRGSAEFVVEQGQSVREEQTIIRLPDHKQMQVKAKVNESRITSVRIGMPVIVKLDALNNQDLQGEVIKVNQYAEPDGFGTGGIKKYAVYVKILDPPQEIRPGMNASVSILVDRRDDAVQIPLQAIYEVKGRTFCLVKNGDDWETREIELGTNNDRVALVKSGVEPDVQVVMNPRRHIDKMELPAIDDSAVGKITANLDDNPALKAAENQEGNGSSQPSAAGSEPPRGAGRSPGEAFAQYDTNSDGKITPDEQGAMPERMRDGLVAAAADKDGVITKAAFFKAMTEMRQRREGGQGGGPGGRPEGQQ